MHYPGASVRFEGICYKNLAQQQRNSAIVLLDPLPVFVLSSPVIDEESVGM